MKYKALITGAGRIGAAFSWHDDEYSHAGAYRALKDRVELLGFLDPVVERGAAASRKWGLPYFTSPLESTIRELKPDIISICTQPETQSLVYEQLRGCSARVLWTEKPYWGPRGFPIPTQVNLMRRADPEHQKIAKAKEGSTGGVLNVTGKLDHHTIPHFEDLARWWRVDRINYTISQGPCSYYLDYYEGRHFPNGGVDGGKCFKGMLENICDFLDNGTPLYSPAP